MGEMKEKKFVTIEYIGLLSDITKKRDEIFFVPKEVNQAIQLIQDYIRSAYGIDKNFTVLINKKRVSEFPYPNLQDDSAIITIVPVLSGG